VINTNPRPGIKAILDQVEKTELTITDVVFIVAPRINAAGRMKHGNYAVTLLTEEEPDMAEKYAAEINEYNLDRRETDRRITEEALKQIDEQKEQNCLTTVVYHESWHKGVIGIVASRLIETYYRPTLVFTKSGNKLAASARSVRGFDVYNALENCKEHLEQFGGHKYAAGLTLDEENFEAFKQAFEDEVSKTIDRTLLTPEINIDAQIDFKDITPKFYRILKQFAPFGPSNMTPVFMSENLIDTGYAKRVGEDKTHLRLTATQPESSSRMVGWSMQFIVIEWQVYSITKDPLSLGVIGLCEFLPAFFLAPFAGHIVDRKEKRNLFAICIALFSLISFGLFYLTSNTVEATWDTTVILYAIYVLVFFGGVLRAFFGPTIFSLIALLVPKRIYPNAATWSSSTWKGASVFGALSGGFLIAWAGVHNTLGIVFMLVMLALILVFRIEKKPIMNKNTSGSIITMLATTHIPITKNTGKKLLIAVFGFGICMIVFGASKWLWLSVVALFFSGVFDGVSMVVRQTILQLKTPDAMRGRVGAVNSMFVGSSNELGALESGVAARIFGAPLAVILGGSVTLLIVGIIGFKNRDLRALDLSKDVAANEIE